MVRLAGLNGGFFFNGSEKFGPSKEAQKSIIAMVESGGNI